MANDSRHTMMLDTALEIVRQAGELALSHSRRGVTAAGVRRKVGRDIVTAVDFTVERLICDSLQEAFPTHSIHSEEAGRLGPHDAEFEWVIDPLDGTINYAAGLPLYSVSLALQHRGSTVLGAIHVPETAERYGAIRDGGAHRDGVPIVPSTKLDLEDAVISVLLTSHFAEPLVTRTTACIDSLARRTRGVRILVSQALELAYVASGRLDGVVALSRSRRSHSSPAGLLLLKEAGGRATDSGGGALDAEDARLDLVATNGPLHEQLLAAVSHDAADETSESSQAT